MLPANCRIYDFRPEICQNFPMDDLMLNAEYQEESSKVSLREHCGYYWVGGKRKGKCNGCGCFCREAWIYVDLLRMAVDGNVSLGNEERASLNSAIDSVPQEDILQEDIVPDSPELGKRLKVIGRCPFYVEG